VRNPETNRCQKDKSKNNDGADYDVDVPNTGGSSFIAIGAVIAIVLAGLGFVAFQYRAEITKFIKKHFKKFKKSA
ncbi:LPXTG cell wall anchor domain-containing protein, partial [Candidatus Saccharibacteria bacterium]|nr:LPXTG cell wall anchor domain-containing protein [Candidatus Saccharibacteria bacterium]